MRKPPDRDICLYSPDPTIWLRIDNISEVENRTLSDEYGDIAHMA